MPTLLFAWACFGEDMPTHTAAWAWHPIHQFTADGALRISQMKTAQIGQPKGDFELVERDIPDSGPC